MLITMTQNKLQLSATNGLPIDPSLLSHHVREPKTCPLYHTFISKDAVVRVPYRRIPGSVANVASCVYGAIGMCDITLPVESRPEGAFGPRLSAALGLNRVLVECHCNVMLRWVVGHRLMFPSYRGIHRASPRVRVLDPSLRTWFSQVDDQGFVDDGLTG